MNTEIVQPMQVEFSDGIRHCFLPEEVRFRTDLERNFEVLCDFALVVLGDKWLRLTMDLSETDSADRYWRATWIAPEKAAKTLEQHFQKFAMSAEVAVNILRLFEANLLPCDGFLAESVKRRLEASTVATARSNENCADNVEESESAIEREMGSNHFVGTSDTDSSPQIDLTQTAATEPVLTSLESATPMTGVLETTDCVNDNVRSGDTSKCSTEQADNENTGKTQDDACADDDSPHIDLTRAAATERELTCLENATPKTGVLETTDCVNPNVRSGDTSQCSTEQADNENTGKTQDDACADDDSPHIDLTRAAATERELTCLENATPKTGVLETTDCVNPNVRSGDTSQCSTEQADNENTGKTQDEDCGKNESSGKPGTPPSEALTRLAHKFLKALFSMSDGPRQPFATIDVAKRAELKGDGKDQQRELKSRGYTDAKQQKGIWLTDLGWAQARELFPVISAQKKGL